MLNLHSLITVTFAWRPHASCSTSLCWVFFFCVNSGLIQREDTTRNSSSYIQKYAYMWRVPTSFTCERTFWTKSSTCWIAEPVEFLINDLSLIKWFDSVIFLSILIYFWNTRYETVKKDPSYWKLRGCMKMNILYILFFSEGWVIWNCWKSKGGSSNSFPPQISNLFHSSLVIFCFKVRIT